MRGDREREGARFLAIQAKTLDHWEDQDRDGKKIKKKLEGIDRKRKREKKNSYAIAFH